MSQTQRARTRPRAANGPGTIEEVWGEDNSWIRVKWDVTGETGCYWVAPFLPFPLPQSLP